MDISRVTLQDCHTAGGLVVAIDVIRAFTTAAHLFNTGVTEIYLVSEVEEAFRLREKMPDCILLGEVKGIRVDGFDFGNSPSDLVGKDFNGRRAIQRTSAGTQGAVLAVNAHAILTAAVVNVSATARYIRGAAPDSVTLIQTGLHPERGIGDEDAACADAIEHMLAGRAVDFTEITRRVRESKNAGVFDGSRPDFPRADVDLASEIDRFAFAMVVERRDGLHVMHRVDS